MRRKIFWKIFMIYLYVPGCKDIREVVVYLGHTGNLKQDIIGKHMNKYTNMHWLTFNS